MNKPKISGLMKKIAFSIPLSVILLAVAGLAVGVCTHNWQLAAGVSCVALWPTAPALMAGPFCDAPRYIGSYKPLTMNGEFSPDAFATMIQELRSQVNSMLSGLPPLEQFETASDLSYGLRSLQNSAANLLELAESLSNNMKQYASKLAESATSKAETELLAKGEYIKQSDADAATQSAVSAKETEVRGAIDNERKEGERVVAARAKLVEDKVCTVVVANTLPADFFKPEDFDGRVAKLSARLKKLADNKINHSEEFVAEMASLAMDEAGEKEFERRVDSVKKLVTSSSSRGEAGSGAGDLAPGAFPATGNDGEVVLVF